MLLQKITRLSSIFANRFITTSAQRLIDVPSSKPLSEDRRQSFDEDKKNMEWRKKPYDKPGEFYSKMKVFLEDENEKDKKTSESILSKLGQPINLRPSAVKKWWKLSIEKKERFFQQYLPERHEILGNNLAAAHFIVHRGGRIRFEGEQNWTQKDENENYTLPNKYVHGLFVEHIDCEKMKPRIYYEGLENIRRLEKLKTISFKGNKYYGDWCLDRTSGSEYENLERLDLSGTKVTHRGLQGLYRIPSLKELVIDNPFRNTEWLLVIAMLQEIMPELKIIDATANDSSKQL